MPIVSDTNILSSLAAANALALLQQLFARSILSIPPAVRDELRKAVDRGKTYLEPLVMAITAGEILLLVMTFLVPFLVALPFYGLEVFVGVIQAFVFAMLTLVFAVLAVSTHDDHGEHEPVEVTALH